MCDGYDLEDGRMTRDEVREKVVEIVCAQLGVAADRINDEASFVNDLGADSLDVVELEMELEDAFKLNEFTEGEAQKMTTLGRAVDLIVWKVNDCKGKHPFADVKAEPVAESLGDKIARG